VDLHGDGLLLPKSVPFWQGAEQLQRLVGPENEEEDDDDDDRTDVVIVGDLFVTGNGVHGDHHGTYTEPSHWEDTVHYEILPYGLDRIYSTGERMLKQPAMVAMTGHAALRLHVRAPDDVLVGGTA